ncbi:MAG: LD-carboxypeptidase [Oscillospiraceae bacterium]|jgi:muramoyltetrapeptide carboxypeptidase LdcA involved in peptidoglycan recycling|nr:LD-carboxypeptidase [Oscillospiraceae bacterium]
MKYPRLLQKGDAIGVCAPSAGVSEDLFPRLNRAISNVQALGDTVVETKAVRSRIKCASADPETRAAEFMSLYENPEIAAIIPPWGGEFLMELLPLLDFDKLAALPPKWICGYSDLTTLTFPLTLLCGIATVHGSDFINMGGAKIAESDLQAFSVMESAETVQHSAPFCGSFTSEFTDPSKDTYCLSQKNLWKALRGEGHTAFSGRMLGGCMDTICKLLGTRFAPVSSFLEVYKQDGFIWTLESCEMTAAEIYRTLWQMRECGWFRYCSGIIYGRPAEYSDTRDFTLTDALERGLGGLGVPVIYDADIGHIPPLLQVVNGAHGVVEFEDGSAVIRQSLKR